MHGFFIVIFVTRLLLVFIIFAVSNKLRVTMKARKSIQTRAKQPVKLRSKKLANGNSSLYLDIYQDGKRVYEFLKLYLVPETTAAAKQENKNTLQLAQTITAQRVVEVNTDSHGLSNKKQRSKVLLREYVKRYAETKTGERKRTFNSLFFHLEKYDANDTQIGKVDKDYILGFVEYLKGAKTRYADKKLSKSTQTIYFTSLKSVLDDAVTNDIITANPIAQVRKNDRPESGKSAKREYLDSEELRRFAETEHPNDLLKRAFMVGCLSGLRHCDIVAMKWANVGVVRNGIKCISLTQQKTGGAVDIPLNQSLLKWMPERGGAADSDLVFSGLISLCRSNIKLPQWAEMAGIHKHITFHSSRHTFAVVCLENKIDLYTVSKLLGHQNIKVTQVYAEILDSTKQAAMDKLDLLNV